MSALVNVLTKTLVALGIASAAYVFVLPLGPSPATCPHAAASTLWVDDALFGVEMPLADGQGAVLVESDRVPLVEGTTFSWRAHLSDHPPWVKLREELVLPAAPEIWRHTESTRISDDRRVAITEEVIRPEGGWVANGWAITEGDPPGEYELRVYLDDQHVKTFRFFVDPIE